MLKGEPVVPKIVQGDRRQVGLHMPPLYKVEIRTCLTSVTCILALIVSKGPRLTQTASSSIDFESASFPLDQGPQTLLHGPHLT